MEYVGSDHRIQVQASIVLVLLEAIWAALSYRNNNTHFPLRRACEVGAHIRGVVHSEYRVNIIPHDGVTHQAWYPRSREYRVWHRWLILRDELDPYLRFSVYSFNYYALPRGRHRARYEFIRYEDILSVMEQNGYEQSWSMQKRSLGYRKTTKKQQKALTENSLQIVATRENLTTLLLTANC